MKNYTSTKSKILELLKSHHIISGETIAKNLKISRTAVWKHIKALQKKGYNIQSTPKGYILKNNHDLLTEEELSDLPYKVYFFQKVTSTMDIAKDLGEKGEEAIVIAETQTKGRGRMQRTWHSPSGGIWMSLLIRPSLSLKQAFLLTYIASLATAFAIEKITNIKVYLKWPNDVIYKLNKEEKKLAGILLEIKAEIDEIKYAVIGIGINVNNEISFLEPKAISLKEITGKIIQRKKIIKELIFTFNKLLRENPKEILNLWKEKSLTIGRNVKIIHPEGEIEGLALKLSEDGALILKTQQEKILKIYSGDCIHL